MLYIYGTCFNNADIISKSLSSIRNLNYEKMFIVDNYSTDKTYEILQQLSAEYRINIMEIKCSRGLGRHKAMKNALNVSKKGDLLMFIDFDMIYSDKFIDFVNDKIDNFDENTIYDNQLSEYDANIKVPWRNINYGEDWERMAHFKNLGYKIVLNNFNNVNQSLNGPREARYVKGIKLYLRGFNNAVDSQRGFCFKEFRDYLNQQKTNKYTLFYFLAYNIAKIKGCYCYDKIIDNRKYVIT